MIVGIRIALSHTVMYFSPHAAPWLERIRAQGVAGRAEWQGCRGGEPHCGREPLQPLASPGRGRAPVPSLAAIFVGHADGLPNGRPLAHEENGVPMLLSRDSDGRFRTILNICRHRGGRLAKASGASIVCRTTAGLTSSATYCSTADTLTAAPPTRQGPLRLQGGRRKAGRLGGRRAARPCFAPCRRLMSTMQAEDPANRKFIVDAFLEAFTSASCTKRPSISSPTASRSASQAAPTGSLPPAMSSRALTGSTVPSPSA